MDLRDPSNGRLIRHGPFPSSSLGRPPVSPAFRRRSVSVSQRHRTARQRQRPWRPVKPTKQFAATTKPFSWVDEDVLKPRSASMTFDQTTGYDHVCVHHQLNLPRNSQDLSVRNAQARNRLMRLRARNRDLRRTANQPDCESMTTVIFACPKCGLAHEVKQVQVPTKKLGRFGCVDCGATIHSWHGLFDYSGCKAVRMDCGRGNAALILRLQILRHLRDRQTQGDVV
jgi:predicted RNA-binding Zn-ribbon protein involved in translation (DUF1610 family)